MHTKITKKLDRIFSEYLNDKQREELFDRIVQINGLNEKHKEPYKNLLTYVRNKNGK